MSGKVDKLESLVDIQEECSRRNCIIIHVVKENQNKYTDEIVVNRIKSEMDLEISPGDIDRIHGIGVPSNGKNRPIFNRFVRYVDRRRVFTNKKRLKRNNKSIIKIRKSALRKARNKFKYSSVWKADGTIMYL